MEMFEFKWAGAVSISPGPFFYSSKKKKEHFTTNLNLGGVERKLIWLPVIVIRFGMII